MKDQPNKVDELFKNSFQDFEIEPANNSWSAIQEKITINRRAKRSVYLLRYAAAASILLMLFAGYYFIGNQKLKTELASKKESIAKNNKGIIISNDSKANGKEVKKVELNDLNNDIEKSLKNNSTINDNKLARNKGKSDKKDINVKKVNVNDVPLIAEKYVPMLDKEVPEIITNIDKSNQENVQIVQNRMDTVFDKNELTPTELLKNIAIAKQNIKSKSYLNSDNEGTKTSILNFVDAANYVAGKIDKREEKFFSINKNAGQNEGYSYQLDLGLFKVKKSRN